MKSNLIFSNLMRNYSKKMDSDWIVRIKLQNPLISAFRLGQSARSVVLQAGLYQLRNSDGLRFGLHCLWIIRKTSG